MDDRQLIADLLSALEYHTEQTRPIQFSKVAIEAAREYLRKPAQQPAQQQEPVAWGMPSAGGGFVVDCITPEEHDRVEGGYTIPLYTSPQPSKPWVGLTEQERNDLEDYCEMIIGKAAFEAIEAKLQEKNTGETK